MDSHSLPLAKFKILITRPAKEDCVLYQGLKQAGAIVLPWPMVETTPISLVLPVIGKTYQGIFFSSQNAVTAFFENESARQWLMDQVESVFAVGSETAALLKTYLPCKIWIPDTYDAMSAVCQWQAEGLWKEKNAILWPCGNLVNLELVDWAQQNNIQLEPLPVYETKKVKLSEEQRSELKADAEQADCWVFTSPSAVEAFSSYIGDVSSKAKVACLGARTFDACKQRLGRCDIVANINTMAGLCCQIVEYYTN